MILDQSSILKEYQEELQRKQIKTLNKYTKLSKLKQQEDQTKNQSLQRFDREQQRLKENLQVEQTRRQKKIVLQELREFFKKRKFEINRKQKQNQQSVRRQSILIHLQEVEQRKKRVQENRELHKIQKRIENQHSRQEVLIRAHDHFVKKIRKIKTRIHLEEQKLKKRIQNISVKRHTLDNSSIRQLSKLQNDKNKTQLFVKLQQKQHRASQIRAHLKRNANDDSIDQDIAIKKKRKQLFQHFLHNQRKQQLDKTLEGVFKARTIRSNFIEEQIERKKIRREQYESMLKDKSSQLLRERQKTLYEIKQKQKYHQTLLQFKSKLKGQMIQEERIFQQLCKDKYLNRTAPPQEHLQSSLLTFNTHKHSHFNTPWPRFQDGCFFLVDENSISRLSNLVGNREVWSLDQDQLDRCQQILQAGIRMNPGQVERL